MSGIGGSSIEGHQPQPLSVLRGENEYGTVYFKDEYFPQNHSHGDVPLDGVLSLNEDLLARLGKDLTQEDIREAAYLDIETTGLGGQMGQYAFLVGIGTFDGLAFRVRQFFLTDPRGEAAMLAAVTDTLARCRSIVSFNGKAFDVPQLTARYRMADQRAPFNLPHIDLLAPVRKLYARELPTCRLAEVETHLLGLSRLGDVAGASIPAAYQAYLRRQSAHGLPPLFLHNSLDVLSLAALLAFMNTDASEPGPSSARHHISLAKWDEASDRAAAAVSQYRRALALDQHDQVGGEAALRLARLLRREKNWPELLSLWTAELTCSHAATRRIRAGVELATLHERTLKAPEQALEFARNALAEIDAASLRAYFALTRTSLETTILRLESRPSQRLRRTAASRLS